MERNVIEETKKTSKVFYSDKGNVTRKYIAQFACISRADDYFCNKNCLSEVFNMLDIVAETKLEELESQSIRLPDKKSKNHRRYLVYRYGGHELYYLYPNSFHRRMVALRKYGIEIPESMDRVVRVVRNLTTHGNATVVLDVRPLNYDDVRKMMLIMADSLIALGAMDPENREPTFEQMRVRPGSKLQRGEYIVGDLIRELSDCRIYAGTKKRIQKDLTIREYRPGRFQEHSEEKSGSHTPGLYDCFFENGTYYIVREGKDEGTEFLSGVIAEAVERLHLSEKGRNSFLQKVLRAYLRMTGKEWPEDGQGANLQALQKAADKVIEEYLAFARKHHLPI